MQGIFELLKKNPHYQLSLLWAGREAHLDTLGNLRELSTCRQWEGLQTSPPPSLEQRGSFRGKSREGET